MNPFRSVSWWLTTTSFKRSFIVILSVIPAVAVLCVPPQVTVDGIFYVSSAKSLFSKQFAHLYTWYREPGYPLFLRAIHLFGDSALLVVLAQGLCIAAGIAIVTYVSRRALGFHSVTRIQLAVTLIFACNPIFIMYAGNFLQQAFFCLLISGFALIVEWSRKLPTFLTTTKLILIAVGLYMVSILTSIGWLYFGLIPLWISAFVLFQKKWKLKKLKLSAKSFTLKAAVVLIAFASIYGLGRITYAGWETFKLPYTENLEARTYVVKPLEKLPIIPDPIYLGSRMLAVMDFIHVEPYEPQNEIFLGASMTKGDPKADYDGAYINKPYSTYAYGYFSMENPSIIGHSVITLFSPIASTLYKVLFAVFIFFSAFIAIKRNWATLFILSVPWSFIFIHAANGTPVDRYGIPTYIFAVVYSALSITLLIDTRFKIDRKSSVIIS